MYRVTAIAVITASATFAIPGLAQNVLDVDERDRALALSELYAGEDNSSLKAIVEAEPLDQQETVRVTAALAESLPTSASSRVIGVECRRSACIVQAAHLHPTPGEGLEDALRRGFPMRFGLTKRYDRSHLFITSVIALKSRHGVAGGD